MSGGISPAAVLGAIARHGRASRAELEAWRLAQLRRKLTHAGAHVPYWRDLFARHGFRPEALRSVADLERLPVTGKRELAAADPAALLARGTDPARLNAMRSSGTSGEPFTVRRTSLEQHLLFLFRLRAMHALGHRPTDRIAYLHCVGAAEARPKPFGRLLASAGLLRTTHIDILQPPERIAAELRACRPDVILTYPGVLDRVAALPAAEREGIRPRVIFTGAEVLTPLVRASLQETFGARVHNLYASTEFHLIAWECPASATGTLHVCDDALVLEVLADGRPARPGERGEAVVTGLHGYAMPLVRYRIGDVVLRGETPCRCGAPFSTLEQVEGRTIDYFRLPNGRTIHPYQLTDRIVWEGAPWVRQFQLVQESPTRVRMRVVPARRPDPAEIARVTAEIAEAMRPVAFVLELVSHIPPEPGGKVRPFVNAVDAA